jgi:hypothetical protein
MNKSCLTKFGLIIILLYMADSEMMPARVGASGAVRG